MRLYILSSLLLAATMFVSAAEPDMIVTQNGDNIKVYNLDITPGDKIYYTLEEGDEAPVMKITKADVLIIKKADGTKIDPTAVTSSSEAKGASKTETALNPDAHEPITCEAISEIVTDKKGNKTFSIKDGNGQLLYMRIVPNEDHVVAVAKWEGKGRYEGEKYVIPEYVKIGDEQYTVKHIDEKAFYPGALVDNKYMKRVVFPSTLKSIGSKAFLGRICLETIIFPEGLEDIEDNAFRRCGGSKGLLQLYIPKSVSNIGNDAFRLVGNALSPSGYFQGNLTCIPDFITTGNCKTYGIDEEAVENYERKIGIRKD